MRNLIVTLLPWILLPCFFCEAFVPPKPGSDLEATYQPLHAYRRRMNITYHYQPKSLHPEMCRFLSEAECQDADESMARHHQRHRDLQNRIYEDRRRARRRLVPSHNNTQLRGYHDHGLHVDTPEELEFHMQEFHQLLAKATHYLNTLEMPTQEEELQELEELLEWDRQQQQQQQQQRQHTSQQHRKMPNPRIGTFRVLVLLMKFSDHTSRKLPQKYEYQILWNLRIRKWLIMNSYGKYDAFFDVQDWKTTDNTEKHYAFGQAGRVSEFQESYWPLLDALDKNKDWDWSPYDVDGNGILDNIIVMHSGYAAEEGGEDCTNGREYLDRIWSHAFSDSNGWVNADGSMQVEGYMIASGLDVTCGEDISRMGVMTHEYLHTFYLIDLYDYTFEGKGIGRFDIMSYPYGFSNDGYIPVSLSVWAKTAIDWLECPEKSDSGTVDMEPIVTSASGCLKIPLQEQDGYQEYLMLENRQQIGFDVDFWKSGVVIYHIDEAANEQYSRGYPGQNGWPKNGNHYKVAVLPADQKYDLEQNVNSGDAEDMWEVGMTIGPNNDGKTYPNTDMYQDGNIKKSGVTIEIKSQTGSNFGIQITNKGRSGGDDPTVAVLSAPTKEQTEKVAIASEQFRTPDAEEYRMSGKIPQLPWFDEAVAEGKIQGVSEEFDPIQVWDSQASSGVSQWKVGGMAVVTFVVLLVGANL